MDTHPPGPADPGALLKIVGERRPPRIGIDAAAFRSNRVLEPTEADLAPYSANPRNRFGDWYEAAIAKALMGPTGRLALTVSTHVKLDYRSPVYAGDRIVDVLVRRPTDRSLGLELKYLHGNGSLVKPKILVDALDFTHRPIDCIYVIDGPGWLETKNVEYLATWWSFTSLEFLQPTLAAFFEVGPLEPSSTS